MMFTCVFASALAACAAQRDAPQSAGPAAGPEGPIVAASPAAHAGSESTPDLGAIERELYPASLVMDHRTELGLTPVQITAMTTDITNTQQEITRLDLDLRAQRENLALLLRRPPIDENAAAQAADALTRTEGTLKVTHLRMLVRIKNVLTEAQRARLDRMRSRR